MTMLITIPLTKLVYEDVLKIEEKNEEESTERFRHFIFFKNMRLPLMQKIQNALFKLKGFLFINKLLSKNKESDFSQSEISSEDLSASLRNLLINISNADSSVYENTFCDNKDKNYA